MPAIATQAETETRLHSPEDFLAELTRATYETALRHGIKGSFTDLYLDIWNRLRNVVEGHRISHFDERNALPPWR